MSGSENHGFYLLVPQGGLDIVNTVDFSPVLCERINERRLTGGEREVTIAGKKIEEQEVHICNKKTCTHVIVCLTSGLTLTKGLNLYLKLVFLLLLLMYFCYFHS